MATEVELAWCAGIVDGEGCIGIVKNYDSYRLTLAIVMTHMETINRLREILESGSISEGKRPEGSKYKDYWSYHISGYDAGRLLRLLRPYLFTKKRQADLAIEFSERCLWGRGGNKGVPDEIRSLRVCMAKEMAKLNMRGR